jgi:hypothetical protein
MEFSNWRNPTPEQLMLEFKIEHELKGCRFWADIEEFMDAARAATIKQITREADASIAYRSRTRSKSHLLQLIKSYKSYPAFRNEATLDAIYEGYEKNLPMDRPLVVESVSGDRRVFSGNSRMDAARHLGIEPEVLLVKSQTPYAL